MAEESQQQNQADELQNGMAGVCRFHGPLLKIPLTREGIKIERYCLPSPGTVWLEMRETSRCDRVPGFPYPAGFLGRFENCHCLRWPPQTRKTGCPSLIVRVERSWRQSV